MSHSCCGRNTVCVFGEFIPDQLPVPWFRHGADFPLPLILSTYTDNLDLVTDMDSSPAPIFGVIPHPPPWFLQGQNNQ